MPLGQPRNHGCRISDGWRYEGMQTLILENELLRVVVLVDKGSDIIEFRYKPRDLDFLFFAPGGSMSTAAPSRPATPLQRRLTGHFWITSAAAGTRYCPTAAPTSITKAPIWASTAKSA